MRDQEVEFSKSNGLSKGQTRKFHVQGTQGEGCVCSEHHLLQCKTRHFCYRSNYYAKSFLIQKGSDGRICFWDKDARTRIKLIPDPKETSKVGYQKYKVVPVVDAAFNYNGK